MKKNLGVLFAATSIAVLVASCGGQSATGAATGPASVVAATALPQKDRRLDVGLTEWSVKSNRQSVPAGAITIVASNPGQVLHDLLIVRSDIGLKDLPVIDGRSDESKMTIIGRFQEFKSGEKEKQFTLDAGRYLLVCNLPAHYQQGMVAQLIVE